jgi:hypothetical protein
MESGDVQRNTFREIRKMERPFRDTLIISAIRKELSEDRSFYLFLDLSIE